MVASSHYQNASEVLREGLRLVQAREAERAARLTALREAVAVGIADIKAGRYTTFEFMGALDRHLASIADRVIGVSKTKCRRGQKLSFMSPLEARQAYAMRKAA